MRLPPSLSSLIRPRLLVLAAWVCCLGTPQALGAEQGFSSTPSSTAGAEPPEAGSPGSEPEAAAGHLSGSTLSHGLREPGNLRYTSSPVGGVGLLRVAGADLGRRGLLRFSATGELLSASNFPVQGAETSRTAGLFAASYVPLDFLEVYAAYGAWSNASSRTAPELLQALGDLTLGGRASRAWLPWLWAGVDMRVLAFSGVGQPGPQAWGLGLRGVATADVRELGPRLPLRAHANLGLLWEGTGSLAPEGRLNAAEEYALGIQRYARLGLGLGVEAPLPVATPFLEYNLALPLGVPGGQLVAPDGSLVPVGAVAPQTLVLGAKVTAVEDVTLTLAAELGLVRSVGLGVAATPPFSLSLGAAYHVDVLGPPRVRAAEPVRVAEPGPRPAVEVRQGQVAGVVVDARTRQPVGNALVEVEGMELPPVATEAKAGRFLTYLLPPGPVRLVVRRQGYREAVKELQLGAGAAPTVEVALEPQARTAALVVSATSKGKPVVGTLAVRGAQSLQVTLEAGAPRRLELPAGSYRLEVVAPGMLAQTRAVELAEGSSQELAWALEPEPRQRRVNVVGDKLELTQPVQFDQGKATLRPESLALLAEVVDVVVRSGIARMRVEGHMDNQGEAAALLELSKARALAVAEQLVRAGLEPARVEAEGFGDTRPVAPNMTPRGRELNRRIELLILER